MLEVRRTVAHPAIVHVPGISFSANPAPAIPPKPGHVSADVQPLGDGLMILSLRSQKNDAGSQGTLLGGAVTIDQLLQLLTIALT